MKRYSIYISFIFIIATLLGVMHHHNDLQEHQDCKVCVVQSDIFNADIPVDTIYVQNLFFNKKDYIDFSLSLSNKKTHTYAQVRAPPINS
jgi:hypothetical protein